MHHTEKIVHKGADYEIRIARFDETIKAGIFRDGDRIPQFEASVSADTACDMGHDKVRDTLVGEARAYIKNHC